MCAPSACQHFENPHHAALLSMNASDCLPHDALLVLAIVRSSLSSNNLHLTLKDLLKTSSTTS